MTNSENKVSGNSTLGNPKPEHSPAHKVDPQHADVKHDELSGSVKMAPAKHPLKRRDNNFNTFNKKF
jgi:hypothetical protein